MAMLAGGSLKSVGIPLKLLHEAHGHVVTVELKNGEVYRGEMRDVEDNWNVQLSNVTATARDGRATHLSHVFIRGSRVRFVIVPDMLKNAPMFKRLEPSSAMKGVPLGTGGKAKGASVRQ